MSAIKEGKTIIKVVVVLASFNSLRDGKRVDLNELFKFELRTILMMLADHKRSANRYLGNTDLEAENNKFEFHS